ncbi:uncharacterized protein LOC113505464 isoform X2 [Trichoplusia ni]|uniref:Uncharacterized protein LOC113505464 isoform X2 n=1 Tax=Trichoplusia ni TaxID=7111 RepID=A0A7E5WT55_TRINI|nr:uncharacterized protein LOC113505464 isoform X2 [Trichoplusia ni]
MVQCSVVGCKSRSERKMENITFHVFPKALILREIWIRATGRQNWQPQLHSRICSIHFERNLFRKTAHRVYLDKFPVPKFLIHLEKDIRNYMKYKMGFSSKILLSEKTLPSKFHCQEDYKRLGESDRQSAVVVQRKRKREKELVRHVEEGCHLEVQNMKDTVQKGVNIVRDEIKPDEDTSGAQGRKTTTDILQMIDKSIQSENETQCHMGSVPPGDVPSRCDSRKQTEEEQAEKTAEGKIGNWITLYRSATSSSFHDASGDPVVSASTSNQPVQSNEKQLITRETRTEHNETYENLADNRQIMVKIEDEEILEKIQNSINYETKTVPQHVEDKVKTDRPRRTQVRKNVLEVTNVVCGSKRKKEVTLKRKVICSPKVYQNALATKVDTIIARVYHFFKKEYDFLAKKYGKLLDLTPFSKHKERTAQATGFHINVVEKAVAEVVKKPGKKPKKKKRKKNIKKIEVEDNSETETGDETFGSGEEMANPAAEPSLTKELRAARKLRSLRDHSYALPISECPDVTPKVEPIEQLSETSTLTSALPETDPLKIEDSFEDTEYLLEDLADIKEEIEFSDEGFS